MRITNNIVLRNSLAGLQRNSSEIQRLQTQLSSGIKVQTSSDDPTAASQIMASSSSLTALDQYKRNIDSATSRSAAEETALDQVNDILARAKELTLSQASDTATPATRLVAAKEMEQLFKQVVSIGSTRFGDAYLFGGDKATTSPFTVTGTGAGLDFTSSNPAGTQMVQTGAGQSMIATHDGKEAFLDSGILTAMRDATKAMAAGDQATTVGSLAGLDTAFDNVQLLLGDSGARTNGLQVAAQNLSALKVNLTTYRSGLQDIDIESAVTQLVQKQTAYQAAMMATSKVLSMSLTDYLR